MSRNIPGDDLAADAVLATDLGDEKERHAAQVAEMGGDIDDIDEFDAAGLDDGSVLPENYDPLNPAPAASQDDEEPEAEAESEEVPEEEVEVEAEAEEEPEAEAESEEEEEEPPAKAPKGIPKWRFDEVNESRKAAEAELARLQAQVDAGKPPEEAEEVYDIRENEKAYMDLLLDGDTEAALAKREEIDAAKYASWKSETQTATRTELHSDAETSELVAMSKEAEQMFDVFNPDSENYNQPMLDKVMVFMRGYEGNMSRGDAFVAALADVVEMYDLMPPEEGDAEPAPKPTGKVKTDPKKAKLRGQAHQPVGNQGGASADTGAVAPSIEDMSDEELDALPEKTLARMRGDIL